MNDWHRPFPEGKDNLEETLTSLRSLYDRGAELVCANEDKSPARYEVTIEVFEEDENGSLVVGEDGRVIPKGKMVQRDPWERIEAHVRAHGRGAVLCYQPSTIGIAVADFDPMITSRVSAVEEAVSPFRATFESSGTIKEAQGSRPAGKGGHGLWRAPVIPPSLATAENKDESTRFFASESGGPAFGEFFYSHPVFGVIVWNAPEWARVAAQGEEEEIDISSIPIAVTPRLASKNADGTWTKGEGSRHDAAISEVSQAANLIRDKDEFEDTLTELEERFHSSISPDERDTESEWDRIADNGRRKWERARKSEKDNLARTSAIAKRKKRSMIISNPEPDHAEETTGNSILFEERKSSFLEMEELFREFLKVEIRFNVRAFEYEYRKIGSNDEWTEVTDRTMAYWVQQVGRGCQRIVGYTKKGKEIIKPDIRSLDSFWKDFGVWFSNPSLEVDPFIDWLESECTEWDGTARLDTWMRDSGMEIANGVEDYVKWVCRFLFLGPLQRAYEPGCELQQMPVLWGKRGTGKSSVVEYTMPVIGNKRRWWSDDFRLAKDSKIMIEMTEGYAIIEWPEMRGIAQIDAEEVKAYASGKSDRTRKAYAIKAESVPRRFVLVATTNNATLKADPALMRRLVVLHIEDGDVGRIRAFLDENRIQLFAEARHRYLAGERAHLDYHLEDGLDVNNSGAVWRNWSIIETIVEVVGDKGTTFSKGEFCESIGEIPAGIGSRESSRIRDRWWRDNGPRYNKALRDLGFEERRVENKRCFVLEDRAVYESVVSEISSHPLPPSCHPQTPSLPGPQPIQGVTLGENSREEGAVPNNSRVSKGGKGGGPGSEGFEGGLRVVEGGRSGGFVPPDDLDDEFGV